MSRPGIPSFAQAFCIKDERTGEIRLAPTFQRFFIQLFSGEASPLLFESPGFPGAESDAASASAGQAVLRAVAAGAVALQECCCPPPLALLGVYARDWSGDTRPPLAYRAVSGTYTIVSYDEIVDCTGTFTVTLPTAVGPPTQCYSVKNSGGGVITVAAAGAETIDGAATAVLPALASVTVVSTGANWIVI